MGGSRRVGSPVFVARRSECGFEDASAGTARSDGPENAVGPGPLPIPRPACERSRTDTIFHDT